MQADTAPAIKSNKYIIRLFAEDLLSAITLCKELGEVLADLILTAVAMANSEV